MLATLLLTVAPWCQHMSALHDMTCARMYALEQQQHHDGSRIYNWSLIVPVFVASACKVDAEFRIVLSGNDVREPELTPQPGSETAAHCCDARGKRE